MLVFEQDGVVRDPNQSAVIYYVIAQTGAAPTATTSATAIRSAWPATTGASSRLDQRRVSLTAIDWATGGAQDMHIAVEVHCLD